MSRPASAGLLPGMPQPQRHALRRWAAGLLPVLLLCGSLGAAPRIETFVLEHASAEALTTTLQPLLGSDGGVSWSGNRLIVKAEAAVLRDIRRLVQELDQPPRRLRLELRQRARVLEQPADGGRGEPARVRITTTQGARDRTQSVTALEGSPVMFRTGRSSALQGAVLYPLLGAEAAPGNPVWVDSYQGLEATVFVSGDSERVRVRVQQQFDTPNTDALRIDRQQLETEIEGPVGSWLPLAATGGATTQGDRPSVRYRGTAPAGARVLELRVTPLD